MKNVILTGDRPTGKLHIGHYVGSLKRRVELQNSGYDIVVVDNLSNSKKGVLSRIEAITGKPVRFYQADVLDREALREIFHLAAALGRAGRKRNGAGFAGNSGAGGRAARAYRRHRLRG